MIKRFFASLLTQMFLKLQKHIKLPHEASDANEDDGGDDEAELDNVDGNASNDHEDDSSDVPLSPAVIEIVDDDSDREDDVKPTGDPLDFGASVDGGISNDADEEPDGHDGDDDDESSCHSDEGRLVIESVYQHSFEPTEIFGFP